MRQTSLLLAALTTIIHAAQPSQPAIFGSAFPPPAQGGWLPPSTSYAGGPYKQAIFLSFDGMHQFDLTNYIAKYPNSTFASIVKNAVVYSNARAGSPSDSLPATSALFSGATSAHSGIFWEQSWDRSLYTGGTNCEGPVGGCVIIPRLKTAWGCFPVYPHNFIRVNTIFEVGRANGLVTAYADKHPSYEFVNGPSGVGLSQGYFPEIASVDSTLEAQNAWDDLHWSALRNWTTGNWANGTTNPSGAPTLYAANFQAITWAQQNAGYLDGLGTPNKSLAAAFQRIDERLGAFIDFLKSAGKLESTLLIVGSKQGQGPVNPKTEVLLDPQAVMDGAGVPVAFFNGEDGGIMFLQNPTPSTLATAKKNLLTNTSLGISSVLAGPEVTFAGFGSPGLDPRVPDLILITKPTTLWNSGFEFMDHGGFEPADLNVPLIAYNPGLKAKNVTQVVSNRQVASSLLQALGLPLAQLDGWRLGDCPVLPGLFG